ncbi:hypothetical protein ACP6L2_01150 [Sphingobacterium lactis]|uniref:hypothetical protein n=1 Tax=Sphingobacterium lactis TaxID=797291 RepID=UPI003F7E3404
MNKRISKIFVIIENGKALYADTNLKEIHNDFVQHAPDISYTMLYNSFRDFEIFERSSKNGRKFIFQVIHNKDYQP